MSEPLTQIIILNLNAAEHTLQCLEAVTRSEHSSFQILVVDNHSRDDSPHRIRAEFPDVEVITAPDNVGFAGGCNLGVRHTLGANPDYFFFLNNDALVDPAALSLLVESGEHEPRAGVFGPMLVFHQPGYIIESLGMQCNWKTGRFRHLHSGLPIDRVPPEILSRPYIEADAVSGCALLVQRRVIEQIGGFNEDYFFYFEDTDFCRRAQQSAFRTLLVPRARVRHKGSATITGINPALRVYYGMRNQLLLFNRNEPMENPAGRLIRDAHIITLNLAYLVFRSGLPRLPALRMWARGISDFYRNRLGRFHDRKGSPDNG